MAISAPSVGALLAERAREHPDRPFLRCEADRLTYAEADARSDRVAAGLAEAGVAPGDRVAVMASNRTEVLELFFGLAKLGAINVPLNVFLKGDFLRYQLEDSEASIMIVDADSVGTVSAVLDGLAGLKRIVMLDDADAPRSVEAIDYGRVRECADPIPGPALQRSGLLSIMYTSGTTGMPKGCMLPHGWYLNAPESSTHMMGYGTGDVLSTALPMFHAWAQGMVMGALSNGIEAVVDPLFSATSTQERWAETGATVYAGVGMMAMAMLAKSEAAADRAHDLRCALIMPMAPDDQVRFEERFGCMVLSQIYGQTECGAIAYGTVHGDRKPGTMGKPSPFYDVRVVDADDREVPIGEVGEVVVRPTRPHGMYLGYWRKPEATLNAWRNLWHHTGDLARADDEGFLTFVDRKTDSLRRRGENVSSLQVEAAITQHPKIAEAAVHQIPSPLTEDDIKACLVLAPGASVTPEELLEHFRAALPAFAVPRYAEVLDELPRNATLRVMKHVLRARGVTDQTWDFDEFGLSVTRRGGG